MSGKVRACRRAAAPGRNSGGNGDGPRFLPTDRQPQAQNMGSCISKTNVEEEGDTQPGNTLTPGGLPSILINDQAAPQINGTSLIAPSEDSLPQPPTAGPSSSFVTVLSGPSRPASIFPDDEEIENVRKKCPRFRILIIGKANAGKTTILQRMCNTTENPIIHDRDGNMVDPSIIDPTDGRGVHDINYELTFSSNAGFVFHDSPGFEASSVEEIAGVQAFIAQRAAASDLKDQLHAIWSCLPTDGDRPLTDAEMGFFHHGTGRVPVIAIFTKYDGMVLKEYNKLRYDEIVSRHQAKELAPKRADSFFRNSEYYVKRLRTTSHPPVRYLRVQNLHDPESNCDELSSQTAEALDNKKLRLLFVSVQKVNVELSTKYALTEFVLPALFLGQGGMTSLEAVELVARGVFSCYGHLLSDHDYSYDQKRLHGRKGRFYDMVHDYYDDIEDLDPIKEETLSFLSGEGPFSIQVLRMSAALLIVAEDSFWIERTGISSLRAFRIALGIYQESPRFPGVMRAVDEVFKGANPQELAHDRQEETVVKMQAIIRKFRTNK